MATDEERGEAVGPDGGLSPQVVAWMRLARVFQKVERASSDHLRTWGLSLAQFDVLAQVGAAEGASQQQLARSLLVTKGNVAQLLNRMEADGLIERRQVGRCNHLYLTDRGRDTYARVVPAQQEMITRLFSRLPDCDCRALRDTLRTLDHALD